jgi:hypothetical protein
MSYIHVFFCRYATHVYISHTARNNHGDEFKFPPNIRMLSIFGKRFSVGEERIVPAYCHDLTYVCA